VRDTRPIEALRAERDWLRRCVAALDAPPRCRPRPSDAIGAAVVDALREGPLTVTVLWRRVELAPTAREALTRRLMAQGHIERALPRQGTPRYALNGIDPRRSIEGEACQTTRIRQEDIAHGADLGRIED
jgi:hypothetical protein